jgi:hypothetical protein
MSQGSNSESRTSPPNTDWITRQLNSFRQGEVVDLPWLIHAAAAQGLQWTPVLRLLRIFSGTAVRQAVVVTQTCDIVRPADKRPYLQLAPLLRVADDKNAKRYTEGEVPQFVAVPELGGDAFVDLDQIITLEKRLVVKCAHRPGVGEEPEVIQRFSQSIGRKFDRYPFPNYFIEAVEPLRKRILRRWDKEESPEGRIFADLVQIRVQPIPVESMTDTEFTLTFIMKQGILPVLAEPPVPTAQIVQRLAQSQQASAIASELGSAELSPDGRAYLYNKLAEAWARLCVPNSSACAFYGEVVGEDEYVLSDYWKSERLDLDQLSGPVTSG